jgi:hypothetical protein
MFTKNDFTPGLAVTLQQNKSSMKFRIIKGILPGGIRLNFVNLKLRFIISKKQTTVSLRINLQLKVQRGPTKLRNPKRNDPSTILRQSFGRLRHFSE